MQRQVVDPRPHQLRAALERRVLRPLRRGDAAGRPDRGVPDAAGLPHPLGRRQPVACGSSAGRQDQPDAERAVRRQGAERVARRARRDRGGPGVPRQLDEYLFEFGWRTTRCTTSPTCRGGRTVDPAWPASTRMIDLDEGEDPEIQSTSSVSPGREELMAKARVKLADDPEKLAGFSRRGRRRGRRPRRGASRTRTGTCRGRLGTPGLLGLIDAASNSSAPSSPKARAGSDCSSPSG